jgi:hypothetical protein
MLTVEVTDAFFQGIANRLSDGELIPFLGSAASYAGVAAGPHRLPNADELSRWLISKLGKKYPGDPEGPLTLVAEFYEVDDWGRPDLYRRLREKLVEEQHHELPNPTAQLLAKVSRPLLIVTTNYDDHLERAYASSGKQFIVVSHVISDRRHPDWNKLLLTGTDGETRAVPPKDFVLSDHATETIIYKMHGTLTFPTEDARDTLIITEQDYIKFLALPSNGHIPPQALTRPFRDRSFLFLGYSLADWNFRVMLRRLQDRVQLEGGGARNHIAIQHDPDPMERRFWQRRGVNLYDLDLGELIPRVREHLS